MRTLCSCHKPSRISWCPWVLTVILSSLLNRKPLKHEHGNRRRREYWAKESQLFYSSNAVLLEAISAWGYVMWSTEVKGKAKVQERSGKQRKQSMRTSRQTRRRQERKSPTRVSQTKTKPRMPSPKRSQQMQAVSQQPPRAQMVPPGLPRKPKQRLPQLPMTSHGPVCQTQI